MIVAPHTVTHSPVESSIPGVMYDMETTVIPDGCSNCGATGVEEFDTPEDIAASDAWWNVPCECDPEDECQCLPPRGLSGRRECPSCKGTGVKDGDGPIVKYRMSWKGDLLRVPV